MIRKEANNSMRRKVKILLLMIIVFRGVVPLVYSQSDMSLHNDSVKEEPEISTENDLNILKERQKHVSEHPDDAEGYYNLATSYWKLSKKGSDKEKADEAIKAVKKAIELTPDLTFVTIKSYYLITQIYKMFGENDKSLEWNKKRVILERKWNEKNIARERNVIISTRSSGKKYKTILKQY